MIKSGRLGRIPFRVLLSVVAIARIDPCGDGIVGLSLSNTRPDDRPDRQRGRRCQILFRRFGSRIGQHGHIIATTFAVARGMIKPSSSENPIGLIEKSRSARQQGW